MQLDKDSQNISVFTLTLLTNPLKAESVKPASLVGFTVYATAGN
jgi:hypothetical protein